MKRRRVGYRELAESSPRWDVRDDRNIANKMSRGGFTDRVFKADHIKIGDGCSMGAAFCIECWVAIGSNQCV